MLRDVIESDLPIFFEHQRDPEAVRMAAFFSRERDAFFAHWQEKVLGNPANRVQTIISDGEVVGYVSSWSQDERRLVAYWVGKAHWGKGVATRALAEFLPMEPERPLFAWVARENVGSIRVLEKNGFRREEGAGDAIEMLMALTGSHAAGRVHE